MGERRGHHGWPGGWEETVSITVQATVLNAAERSSWGLLSIYWILHYCSSVLKLTPIHPIKTYCRHFLPILCLVIDTLAVVKSASGSIHTMEAGKHYKFVFLFLVNWLLNRYQPACHWHCDSICNKMKGKMAFSNRCGPIRKFSEHFFMEMNYLQSKQLSFWTFFEVGFYLCHRTL